MIQLVKHEFERLDDLVKYVNNTSISYGYLKDYQIIKENDEYNVILNFDVPEVCDFFELAKLNLVEGQNRFVYRNKYTIDVEKKSENTWLSSIIFNDLKEGFKIQGSFGFKNIFNLIEITYDSFRGYFTVKLGNASYENRKGQDHIENNLCVEYIDHEIIYNHLVKLFFNRGYLIDKSSLEDLKQHLCYVVHWLNRRNFYESEK